MIQSSTVKMSMFIDGSRLWDNAGGFLMGKRIE